MLGQSQLDEFHRTGFLVLPGLFGPDEIDALRAAAADVQAEAVAGEGQGHSYRDVGGERRYFRTDGLWDRSAAFRSATVKPELLAAVGQCIGHPFLPINDSIVVKLPGSGVPIEWHQDPPYYEPSGFRETYGVPNFDVDIYLDVADLDTGCLFGIPAHHLVGRVGLERFDDDELFERADAVALELQPGDVLFHALSAPHGSRANEGETIRRVFYVHYMAQEVLDHCYSDWSGEKRGFSPEGLAFAQSMLDERGDSLTLEEVGVELTERGFLFTREPATPARHWDDLIGRIPPEELERKRALA